MWIRVRVRVKARGKALRKAELRTCGDVHKPEAVIARAFVRGMPVLRLRARFIAKPCEAQQYVDLATGSKRVPKVAWFRLEYMATSL